MATDMIRCEIDTRAGAQARARAQSTTRLLNTRPDTPDFRDRMFAPTLVEVPAFIPLDEYRAKEVPILDQGREGACTGFGLATVANYLLRTRRVVPDEARVSARMLYEMARRYDEWAGENYDGSSARGAMKGWNKHGVCSEDAWKSRDGAAGTLTDERAKDASNRPLGAYYRVNHKDLVAMHTAIAEVGILYASGLVHKGWSAPREDGHILLDPDDRAILGGHAFAIVAYDADGFWIQNSWGDDWGNRGFGHLTYDDWLDHGSDVWVARLAVPVHLSATVAATAHSAAAGGKEGYSFAEIRPHVISIGNDGELRNTGTFATNRDTVRQIVEHDFPEITKNWATKRLLLYAHGGLNDEPGAIQRVADYRTKFLEREVFPLAFVWRTDYWTTLKNILEDAVRRRRPEGFWDASKDFLLDRADDALEPLVRSLTGKAEWDEMKENARLASANANRAARVVASHVAAVAASDPTVEVHMAAHSAGSIMHGHMIPFLCANIDGHQGVRVATATLWAPAMRVDLFKDTYLKFLDPEHPGAPGINRLTMFTLTDDAEQDDNCNDIYHKSLLYLVSNAFENPRRIPIFRPDGAPILGMEKFINKDDDLKKLFRGPNPRAEWILAPNTAESMTADASRARRHGAFDDDKDTVTATLARILGVDHVPEVVNGVSGTRLTFRSSAGGLRDRRSRLQAV